MRKLPKKKRKRNELQMAKLSVDTVRLIVESIEEAHRYTAASRFDWKGAMQSADLEDFAQRCENVAPGMRQSNIMNFLQALPKIDGGYPYWYKMFCDFVHPNLGSYTLVLDSSDVLSKNQVKQTLSYRPGSLGVLHQVLEVISYPLSRALPLTREQIGTLLRLENDVSARIRWTKKAFG